MVTQVFVTIYIPIISVLALGKGIWHQGHNVHSC